MTRHRIALSLAFAGLGAASLGGCGPGALRGHWEGTCQLTDGEYGTEAWLEADLRGLLSRELSGEGAVTFLSQGMFPADVVAERAGESALLGFSFTSPDGELELVFEGVRDGDELEGGCELWLPDAIGPVVGVGELSR
ncbi:MAG: hypothetical protein H6742_02675 [Alphaproteobacteria bacterium]|nr:hypothetical protein [Alphaproteobacteria bacterium]